MTLEGRQRAAAAKRKPLELTFLSGDEVVAQLRAAPPSSEFRLDELKASAELVDSFSTAAASLARSAHLTLEVYEGLNDPPPLSRDTVFKYCTSYAEIGDRRKSGEDIVVGVAIEAERVICFGLVKISADRSDFEILDVDTCSRRSSGLETRLTVSGEQFGVGIGHAVAAVLLARVPHPVLADATNSASRYILKALGFVRRPGESNPCLLCRLEPGPAD